jgi:aldose 1-epimerase
MKFPLSLALLFLSAAQAQNYTAQKMSDQGVDIVRLTDAAHGIEVSVAPSIGNGAYAMRIHGKNIFNSPAADAGQLKQARNIGGIPFLAPWANRMADGGFWANGRKYTFNAALGTVRVQPNGIALHGMLTTSPLWEVTSVGADAKSAHVTSRLEFWKYPDLMANWPFAHEYEMTYRLADGMLEVQTTVVNRSAEPMPLALGYHPCYVLPGVPRDQAVIHIPAKTVVVADSNLVATGEMKPMDLPDPTPLKGRTLDTGYTDLIRGDDGRALFYFEGGGKRIESLYGPKWQVSVVYEPANSNIACFEPMAAITNGVNLAHEGKYPQLQMLAPGATWKESFWVRASGL